MAVRRHVRKVCIRQRCKEASKVKKVVAGPRRGDARHEQLDVGPSRRLDKLNKFVHARSLSLGARCLLGVGACRVPVQRLLVPGAYHKVHPVSDQNLLENKPRPPRLPVGVHRDCFAVHQPVLNRSRADSSRTAEQGNDGDTACRGPSLCYRELSTLDHPGAGVIRRVAWIDRVLEAVDGKLLCRLVVEPCCLKLVEHRRRPRLIALVNADLGARNIWDKTEKGEKFLHHVHKISYVVV